jgi:hypothetical protein
VQSRDDSRDSYSDHSGQGGPSPQPSPRERGEEGPAKREGEGRQATRAAILFCLAHALLNPVVGALV